MRSKARLCAACVAVGTFALVSGCESTSALRPAKVNQGEKRSARPVTTKATNTTPPAPPSNPVPSYPPPPPPNPPIVLAKGGRAAISGKAGMVTSVEPHATRVGVEVLENGGNAIDAAVAVAYALAVTHPSAGNIGGGGFMVVRLASGEVISIDFRETSPAIVTTDKLMAMVDKTKDDGVGWRSAAVPGSVAGLNFAREHYGTKPLKELLAPAIALARKGHKLGARQALVLGWSWDKLKKDRGARAVYSRGGKGKAPLSHGELFRQPDLARTLERIAEHGDAGFYEGPVAEAIDGAMKKNGGYLTAADLKTYKPRVRTPLRFNYRGFTVDTMPPPSMGGIAFAEIMLQLERLRAHQYPPTSADAVHIFVEAAKRAYADRRSVGADPDFNGPGVTAGLVSRLLDGAHLEGRKPAIDLQKATPATDLSPPAEMAGLESPQTTHFGVVDAAGNAVACTTTQSASFGSKVVIPGTGVLLSNAEGAFSETGPNSVAPHKRMASSMTPTIVTQNNKLVAVLGSPGGDTIPNTVSQVLRNLVDYGMTVDQAVMHSRVHHQYLPDEIRVEKANPPPLATLQELRRRGHSVRLDAMPIGDANSIVVDETGTSWGYADTREGGLALGLAAVKEKR